MITYRDRTTEIKGSMCWVLFFASCLALHACSGSAPNGTLEIRVKDHREAIGDFLKASMTIEAIRLSPKVGFKVWQLGWIDLAPSVDHVELTQFIDRSAATVFRREIPSASFEALDLKVRSVNGILKKDSTPITISNKITPVALSFSVNPGEATTIILDLVVMDMSDHPPEAYELQLSGYEIYRNGKLLEKIPPG